MIISSAQITTKVGDVNYNLEKHLHCIDVAAQKEAELIVFPEMSLTGYCLEEGRTLAIGRDEEVITKLSQKAQERTMIIIAGAPIYMDDILYIGSYIIMPNGEAKIYTKRYVHHTEQAYYTSCFDHNPVVSLHGEIIQLAICADIDEPNHPKLAKKCDCTLYIPSILFSEQEIDNGHASLKKYAETYSFAVLMSNYVGQVGRMIAGGRSAFWNRKGVCIAALGREQEGLVVMERINDDWVGQKCEL